MRSPDRRGRSDDVRCFPEQPDPADEEDVMNSTTRVIRRPRAAGSATARTVAAVIATAVLTLLAACTRGSGGPGMADAASSPSGTASASPLAFSRCMRSHGVPNFPDPDSSGALPKVGPQQLGVSSSEFEAAQNACAPLLRPSDAQVLATLSGMRDFARCMRSHGVTDWPDPTTDTSGQPVFDLRGRIAPDSPRMDAKSNICDHLLHPAPGENRTVLCNGIGEDGCHEYG
jgi:hypothetical protein